MVSIFVIPCFWVTVEPVLSQLLPGLVLSPWVGTANSDSGSVIPEYARTSLLPSFVELVRVSEYPHTLFDCVRCMAILIRVYTRISSCLATTVCSFHNMAAGEPAAEQCSWESSQLWKRSLLGHRCLLMFQAGKDHRTEASSHAGDVQQQHVQQDVVWRKGKTACHETLWNGPRTIHSMIHLFASTPRGVKGRLRSIHLVQG